MRGKSEGKYEGKWEGKYEGKKEGKWKYEGKWEGKYEGKLQGKHEGKWQYEGKYEGKWGGQAGGEMGMGEVAEVAKLPWTIFLKWGTADTEIKISAKNPELSKAPSFRPEGQNIALYALPPSRDSTFQMFAFPRHSTLNNWHLDLNPADVAVSHHYIHTYSRPATLGGDKRNLPLEVLLLVPLTFQTDRAALSRGGCTDLILSTVLHRAALDGAGHSPSLALTPCAFVHNPLLSWLQNNISNTKTDYTESGARKTLSKTSRGKLRCKL